MCLQKRDRDRFPTEKESAGERRCVTIRQIQTISAHADAADAR